MKLERLIAIIYKLLNHEVLSASMLAEEFQVSPRTIYRDIDAICAAGFPVISHQGQNGGYGMMDGYKMDKSLLGSYDVASLITVLRSLSSVFEDERVQGTIERLQTIGPEHQTPSVAVDFETRRTDPDALPQLRTAITERNIVRFDYINTKNERTTREMEPVRLHFKFGNWYVYGYCRTRRDYREFRLSRMLNLIPTPNTFQPHREEARKAALSNGAWQEQVEDVVIRVGPEGLAEAMDQFHQMDRQFHPDGGMTIRIPVYRPHEARWLWSILLGFGSGAEVLEPPALRCIIAEQLRNALKLYEEV
ncbi:helix-turn-helix transcriptional regulator [Paenibacillus arenilitoris]|uniref:YafY family transcriptional regulator n=1 Tax=Paenibacillus arenilitoris TaxID=2772299 RepID=A0A927CM76_9BACL|nr:YafY family protein [Paenibacillus arenilitoris]MBD2869153.1 YafY family transcriptional regulator [Paenibacillus arenilitoris]